MTYLQRMTGQEQTGLHHLAQENVDDILRDVQASCGFKGLANCRLVSKSWQAAVQLYPMKAEGAADMCKLRTLSKISPNMASMAIKCRAGAELNLAPLRNCSRLTSMSLSARKRNKGGKAELTVIDLPSSLKEVKIRNLFLPPNSLVNATRSLTQLHYQLDKGTLEKQRNMFQPGGNPVPKHWKWMQDLQHLQVINTGISLVKLYQKVLSRRRYHGHVHAKRHCLFRF